MSRFRAPTGPQPDPTDFCNAFWTEPHGYHNLLTRVKATSRHLEDLRLFLSARIAAEDDYAKKLAGLAKAPVLEGVWEVGGFRKALGEVRRATQQMAHSHACLAGTIREKMYGVLEQLIRQRDDAKKEPQSAIEKLHKKRLDLAECLEKAEGKYKADVIAVNGFQAQLLLCGEGREQDRVHAKLDKVRMSVKITEKEYRMHLDNSQRTTEDWNTKWREFCDLSQDQEEERLETVHRILFDYANAVSAVAVVEDEQCERIRQKLDMCDMQKDVKTFVSKQKTGPEMKHAPRFVDYPEGQDRPKTFGHSTAAFLRESKRAPGASAAASGPSPIAETQAMVEALQARPPSPVKPDPEEVERERVARRTERERMEERRKGGSIAEMVAANAFRPTSMSGASTPLRSPLIATGLERPMEAASIGSRPLSGHYSTPEGFIVGGHPPPLGPGNSLHRSPSLESTRSAGSAYNVRPGSTRKPLPVRGGVAGGGGGMPRLPSAFGRPPGWTPPTAPVSEPGGVRQSRGSTPSWVPSVVRAGHEEV